MFLLAGLSVFIMFNLQISGPCLDWGVCFLSHPHFSDSDSVGALNVLIMQAK